MASIKNEFSNIIENIQTSTIKEHFFKILKKLPAEKGLPFRQYGNNPIYDDNNRK